MKQFDKNWRYHLINFKIWFMQTKIWELFNVKIRAIFCTIFIIIKFRFNTDEINNFLKKEMEDAENELKVAKYENERLTEIKRRIEERRENRIILSVEFDKNLLEHWFNETSRN